MVILFLLSVLVLLQLARETRWWRLFKFSDERVEAVYACLRAVVSSKESLR
jgi:hypothetical protein